MKRVLLSVCLIIVIGLLLWRTPVTLPPPEWSSATALRLTTPILIEDDLAWAALPQALQESIAYYRSLPTERLFSFGDNAVSAATMAAGLQSLYQLLGQGADAAQISQYLQYCFDYYQSAAPEVLFTGYYEPRLRGSRQRSPTYQYPLYGRPADLYRIQLDQFPFWKKELKVPRELIGRLPPNSNLLSAYFDRGQIDYEGALADRGLELLWVDDPIAVFFLQIQGSGIVELEDGSEIKVGYAERNGHPYRPIGRLLINEGKLSREAVSMQSIKAYLRANPDEQERIFRFNPSYVFFEIRKAGPIGSLGRVLTTGRSIATDAGLFPRGALAIIQAEKPAATDTLTTDNWQPFWRLVLNQDTGGAITGPGRVDLFTGSDEAAAFFAGHLKSLGQLYFLAPRASAACTTGGDFAS